MRFAEVIYRLRDGEPAPASVEEIDDRHIIATPRGPAIWVCGAAMPLWPIMRGQFPKFVDVDPPPASTPSFDRELTAKRSRRRLQNWLDEVRLNQIHRALVGLHHAPADRDTSRPPTDTGGPP